MMMKATTTASALRSSNNHVHGSFSPGGNHALGNGEKDRVTRELDAMQTEVELWYRRTGHDITSTHHHLSSLIQSSIDTLQGILFPGSNTKNGLPGSNVVHIPTSNHGLSSDGRGFHSSSLNNNNGTPLRSSSSNSNNNNNNHHHHHHHQVLAPQANFPPSQVGNTHLHHAPHNGHVMDTETTTQPTASTPYMERRPFHGSSTSSASNSVPDTHSSYNTLLSEGGNESDAAYLFRGMKSGHTASPHLTSMALNDGKFALQATAQPFVPGSTGGSSPPMQHGSNPNLPTAYRSTPNERGNNIVAQIMARGSAGSTGSGEIDPLDSSNSSAASSTRGLLITHGPGGRPLVQRGVHPSHLEEATRHIVPHLPCQVLVEFKRKRILQFECEQYVPPGEYVVVGGDRGEDVGLVIYTWQETPSGSSNGYGVDGAHLNKWVCVGLGKVIRIANPLEVSQLHGVQSELERRAVEVAEQKVLEHSLNMRVVDAEYQFDRKKLTFYYEAQSRLDFRDLVRDLYKAFRARIWMEMVETHGNSNSSLSASLPRPQTPTLQGSNNTRTEGSETSSFGGAFSSSGNGRGGNGFVNNSYYEPNGDGTKGFGWGPEDDDEVFPAGGGPHEHSEGELGNLDALHHVMLTPPLMRSHGTPTQVVSQRSYQTRMNHSNVQAHLSHKMNDQNQNVGDDDHIHSPDASNNAYPIKKEEGLNNVTSHHHSTPHGIENTGANESSPDSAVETSAARNAVAQCMYED